MLVPQDRDGTPQSIQDLRTEDDASSVGRPEEFNLESDEHGERHSEADTESLPGDGTSAVSVDDMFLSQSRMHCGGTCHRAISACDVHQGGYSAWHTHCKLCLSWIRVPRLCPSMG